MSQHASAMRRLLAPGALAAFIGAGLCVASASPNATTATATGALPASAIGAPGSADSPEDIRDIRGPQWVVPAWLLPALVAGGAVLVLGTYGVWRWQRRRRRPCVLLPYEVALQRLESIRTLMQPESAREFSIAVSDIVRTYIEQGFELTATHRTTEEFLRDLIELSNSALGRHRALLSEFLHQCDLVKFAGMSLTFQSMESLHHSACDFVRATARSEEAAQVGTERSSRGGEKAHDSLPST